MAATYKKTYLPKGLEHAWVCTRLGADIFKRWQPLAEGEKVAHIEHKSYIDGKPVNRKSPILPAHHTFTRDELEKMVKAKTDHIGLPLAGSFARAVGDALAQFEALDKQAAAPEPICFELVEAPRVQETPMLRVPALVA